LLIWLLPADFRIFRIWLLFAASAFAVHGEWGGTEPGRFARCLALLLVRSMYQYPLISPVLQSALNLCGGCIWLHLCWEMIKTRRVDIDGHMLNFLLLSGVISSCALVCFAEALQLCCRQSSRFVLFSVRNRWVALYRLFVLHVLLCSAVAGNTFTRVYALRMFASYLPGSCLECAFTWMMGMRYALSSGILLFCALGAVHASVSWFASGSNEARVCVRQYTSTLANTLVLSGLSSLANALIPPFCVIWFERLVQAASLAVYRKLVRLSAMYQAYAVWRRGATLQLDLQAQEGGEGRVHSRAVLWLNLLSCAAMFIFQLLRSSICYAILRRIEAIVRRV